MAGLATLRGGVAIVTGASSGIGRATALALAAKGARLSLASRKAEALARVAAEIESLGGEALVLPTDVTDRTQVEELVRRTLERWGRVDVLVANAGAYIRCPACQLTIEVVERSLAVNFFGELYAVVAALPHMLRQRGGHIVLMSSVDGKKGIPPDAPYAIAKYAVAGLGEVLRQELHGTGVSLTTVFPGRVDTPLIADLRVPWISPKIAPESVASAIVRAIELRQAEVIVPFPARLLLYANTFSPRLGDWLTRRLHFQGWQTAPPS